MGVLRRGGLAGLLALLALLGACGGEISGPPPEVPRRIVALAPSSAEILHVLGLGDRVVGVGDYVQWPPEWRDKPRLGGLFNVQLERIVALEPDLGVLLRSETRLADGLRRLGVDVLVVPSETLGDVEVATLRIAERCGAEEAAEAFLKEWRQRLAADPLPEALRVVLVVGREPGKLGQIVVAGRGTFFHELAGRLGAVNVFAEAGPLYPQVGAEEILRRRPDAIVELQPLELTSTREVALREDWVGLEDLGAEVASCVQVVSGKHVLIPGPRLDRLYGELRRALEGC